MEGWRPQLPLHLPERRRGLCQPGQLFYYPSAEILTDTSVLQTTLFGETAAAQFVSDLATNQSTQVTAYSTDATIQAGYNATYSAELADIYPSAVGQAEILLANTGTYGGYPNSVTTQIQAAVQHPMSRGSVKINSTSTFDQPQIDPGYFTHPADIQVRPELRLCLPYSHTTLLYLPHNRHPRETPRRLTLLLPFLPLQVLRQAFKYARTISQTPPFSDYVLSELSPGTGVSTDEEWETWIRGVVSTEYRTPLFFYRPFIFPAASLFSSLPYFAHRRRRSSPDSPLSFFLERRSKLTINFDFRRPRRYRLDAPRVPRRCRRQQHVRSRRVQAPHRRLVGRPCRFLRSHGSFLSPPPFPLEVILTIFVDEQTAPLYGIAERAADLITNGAVSSSSASSTSTASSSAKASSTSTSSKAATTTGTTTSGASRTAFTVGGSLVVALVGFAFLA